MKSLKNVFLKFRNKANKRFLLATVTASSVLATATGAFADATTPASMITDDTKSLVADFMADIVPTVLDLIGLVLPVGLTLWGIGFAVKKGIGFVQKRAKQAL